MKFTTKDGKFEVSNLTKVVANDVELNIDHKTKGHPARLCHKQKCDKPTIVHVKTQTAKGERWLKYRIRGLLPEHYEDLKPEDGSTPEEIRDCIQATMARPGFRVWFSGDTCNIERQINYVEAQRIITEENFVRTPRRRRFVNFRQYLEQQSGMEINDAIRLMIEQAARKAGAKVSGPIMIVEGKPHHCNSDDCHGCKK